MIFLQFFFFFKGLAGVCVGGPKAMQRGCSSGWEEVMLVGGGDAGWRGAVQQDRVSAALGHPHLVGALPGRKQPPAAFPKSPQRAWKPPLLSSTHAFQKRALEEG